MRLVSARWISLFVLIAGLATAATTAVGAAGRWKLGDDGSCSFDENDAGPDQCSPQPGRWKLGGDGNCYFDAQDSGPNQCLPFPTEPGALESSDPLPEGADRAAIEARAAPVLPSVK
jgi:hypothetical protein